MKGSKKAFITGSTGFVGANLTRKLLQLHYDVHILIRKNAQMWRLKEILPQLHIHYSDLSDSHRLGKILKKISPDYIFHLAAYGAYATQDDLELAIKTNVVGLMNLLNASKTIPYTVFVNTGSSSEYGNKSKPMKENDLLEPDSYYAATKASATHIASVFAKKYNKPIVTFRLFSVYGSYEEPTRLIPTLITSALKNRPIFLTKGIVKRDFIHIDDVVYAYLQAARFPHIGEVYNIGTGHQYSNQDIAKVIKKLNYNQLIFGKKAFPNRSWDKSFWVADVKHARKDLRWTAKLSLEEGLRKTYSWFINSLPQYAPIYG